MRKGNRFRREAINSIDQDMGLQHCGTVPLRGMVIHTSVVKNQFLMVRFFRCTISAIAAKEGQKKSGQEFASGRESPNHKLDTKNLYPYT